MPATTADAAARDERGAEQRLAVGPLVLRDDVVVDDVDVLERDRLALVGRHATS